MNVKDINPYFLQTFHPKIPTSRAINPPPTQYISELTLMIAIDNLMGY